LRTEPPFAHAAIEYAKNLRICGMPVAATQLMSPKRSLKSAARHRIQNGILVRCPNGCSYGGRLRQLIHATAISFYHTRHASELPFEAGQAIQRFIIVGLQRLFLNIGMEPNPDTIGYTYTSTKIPP